MYRYAQNSPVVYSDPTGQSVYVGYRSAVGGPPQHLSIILMPDNPEDFVGTGLLGFSNSEGRRYGILSAFPEGAENPNKPDYRNLDFQRNNRSDRLEKLGGLVEIFPVDASSSDTVFIWDL